MNIGVYNIHPVKSASSASARSLGGETATAGHQGLWTIVTQRLDYMLDTLTILQDI